MGESQTSSALDFVTPLASYKPIHHNKYSVRVQTLAEEPSLLIESIPKFAMPIINEALTPPHDLTHSPFK